MSERALEVARASGLVAPRRPLLVLLSGGADSVCLLDVCLRLNAELAALHVNYGLRPGAADDEACCRALCERLEVPLAVERVRLPAAGNLQERARELRYALAERHALGDYAAAHTAADQAETVLYRLASSPGRRALLGMEPRRGRLVRPLLELTRAETRAYCRARGLGWREDPSNDDPRFARARVRHELLPALRSVSEAAEQNVAETARQLRDEHEVLERAVDEALTALGGGPAVAASELRRAPPALARLVLRRLAERAAPPGARAPALSRRDADSVLALGERGGTRALDLGGGVRAIAEYGTLRFSSEGEAPPPGPVELRVPGRARFGAWEVEARLLAPGDVALRRAALGRSAIVRGWRDGDRMRPAGLGGSRSLQDLFTDRKVPRALRRGLPVVEAAGAIAWVAGVAVDERFAARSDDPDAVYLSARSLR